jgi:hypothetical protein
MLLENQSEPEKKIDKSNKYSLSVSMHPTKQDD